MQIFIIKHYNSSLYHQHKIVTHTHRQKTFSFDHQESRHMSKMNYRPSHGNCILNFFADVN